MKKIVLLFLALLVILLGIAYVKLFSRQTNYFKTIGATDSGVLVLNNFDLGNIKIVTTNKNEISFDLDGDPSALAALDYESDLLLVRFGLSRDWSGVSGIIYVPEGTLLDITLSEDSSLRVNDLSGQQKIENKKSFLVDTKGLNFVQKGGAGELVIDGWGDVIVWDDESWDLLDNTDNGEDSVNNTGGDGASVYCGVGSQAIRNYCCLNENTDVDPPVCNGMGHWVFSNVERVCDYTCDSLPEGLGEDDNEEVVDCGLGGQSQRNECCYNLHAGEYQGCLGSWRYNNSSQTCQFDCDSGSDSGEIPGGSTETVGYDDPVSTYCSTVNSTEERDLCCNDSLKNELSTGPRPGFPDCIGTWHFDARTGCEFSCAEQAEMIRILNELKQKISN